MFLSPTNALLLKCICWW